jgi:integrase
MNTPDINMLNYSKSIALIATLLSRSGGRVSEILSIKLSDISSDGLILVHGKKGSRSYTIYALDLLPLIAQVKTKHNNLFNGLNRSTVHRGFLKFGLTEKKVGKKVRTVTHIFRYKKAKWINSLTDDKVTIQDIIGHNSIKSQNHYIGKNGKH